MTVWVIRADDESARNFALENNCAVIGSGLGDIRNMTEADVEAESVQVYPGKSKSGRSQKIGNVRRFVRDVKCGDIAVLKLAGWDEVAIGKIVGCYEHNDGAEPRRKHRRSVEWLHPSFPLCDLPSPIHGQLTVHRYGGDHDGMRHIVEAS